MVFQSCNEQCYGAFVSWVRPVLTSECSITTSRCAKICKSTDPYFMLPKVKTSMRYICE